MLLAADHFINTLSDLEPMLIFAVAANAMQRCARVGHNPAHSKSPDATTAGGSFADPFASRYSTRAGHKARLHARPFIRDRR